MLNRIGYGVLEALTGLSKFFSGLFNIAFSRFRCTVLMITPWRVVTEIWVRNTSMTKKRGLTKVTRVTSHKTKWSHDALFAAQYILSWTVKFLVLICRSFQVSKTSSWEFVGELSNTTCVLNCEKQGHEKK